MGRDLAWGKEWGLEEGGSRIWRGRSEVRTLDLGESVGPRGWERDRTWNEEGLEVCMWDGWEQGSLAWTERTGGLEPEKEGIGPEKVD